MKGLFFTKLGILSVLAISIVNLDIHAAENGYNKTLIAESSGSFDNYYNSIKVYDDSLIYVLDNGLYKQNIDGSNQECLLEGKYFLGNIKKDVLYLSTMEDNAVSIEAISLVDYDCETLFTIETNNSWCFSAPYVDDFGIIYCEERVGTLDLCHVFSNRDGTGWQEIECRDKEGILQGLGKESDCNLIFYVPSVIKNNVYITIKENIIEVFSLDNKEVLRIEDFGDNILILEDALVYTNKKKEIVKAFWESGLSEVLYSRPEEKGIINYGTYDDLGLYGFMNETETSCDIVHLYWDGRVEEVGHLETNSMRVKNLSVMNGIVYYIWNDELFCIEQHAEP